MSQMKLQPVYKCRYDGCGRTVVVTHLSTARPDSDTRLLQQMMAGLSKIALCPYHQRQRTWYSSQGRSEEWEHMAARQGALIVVHDREREQMDAAQEA